MIQCKANIFLKVATFFFKQRNKNDSVRKCVSEIDLIYTSATILEQLKPTTTRYCSFGLHLKFFKTCLLRRSFPTLINNVSFSSPINVESHKHLERFLIFRVVVLSPTGAFRG